MSLNEQQSNFELQANEMKNVSFVQILGFHKILHFMNE